MSRIAIILAIEKWWEAARADQYDDLYISIIVLHSSPLSRTHIVRWTIRSHKRN